MPAIPSRLLFAAVCVAVLLGGWQGGRLLPWGFETPDPNPRWAARYEALVPLVAGSTRILFAQEDGEGGVHRLFRAQFVLSPAVLEERSSLDQIQIRHLTSRPLVLDYRSAVKLRADIAELRRRAEAIGFELTVDSLGQTAVVRARRRARR